MGRKFVSLFKNKSFYFTLLSFLFMASAIIVIAIYLGKESGLFVIRVKDGELANQVRITNNILDSKTYTDDALMAPGVDNVTDYCPQYFLDKSEGKFATLRKYTRNAIENGGLYTHKAGIEEEGMEDSSGVALYVYSFYILNRSTSTVQLSMDMKYSAVQKNIDDIVRIATYVEKPNGQEEIHIYATPDTDKKSYDEYESTMNKELSYKDCGYPVATESWAKGGFVFEDQKLEIQGSRYANQQYTANDDGMIEQSDGYIKYSVIFWLEGDDYDSIINSKRYEKGSIRFELDINIGFGD